MKVLYHKKFNKNFRKRFGSNEAFCKRYEQRLALFRIDPQNPILKNHPLIGEKSGLYAFSITGDIRIVYYLEGETAYLLDIGTHNQVY